MSKLAHFACFVRNGEAGDVVAVVTEVETFAGTEDDHADIELSAATLAGIRFFEFILLLVGTFFEALHDSGLVGFALGECFVGIRTLDRLIGFGFSGDILLHVLNGLNVLRRSDDEGLWHTCDKVFVSGPLREMGFLVMFEDGIGIERQFSSAFPAIISHFFHGSLVFRRQRYNFFFEYANIF